MYFWLQFSLPTLLPFSPYLPLIWIHSLSFSLHLFERKQRWVSREERGRFERSRVQRMIWSKCIKFQRTTEIKYFISPSDATSNLSTHPAPEHPSSASTPATLPESPLFLPSSLSLILAHWLSLATYDLPSTVCWILPWQHRSGLHGMKSGEQKGWVDV